MSSSESLEIGRLTRGNLDEVLRIHRAGMGYTLNVRLGPDHLRYLYASMMDEPTCYVGICLVAGQPAGVVSGTIDAPSFSARLLRQMPANRLLHSAVQMMLTPELLRLWVAGNITARPVHMDGDEVRAVLTAIVVDPQSQRHGIGRALVTAFEEFLFGAGVRAYRLDTLIRNERAARFYRDIGFIEADRRADSIIFVRRLPA